MDPRLYSSRLYGEPRREPGNRHAFWYYHPFEIPTEVRLDSATVYLLSEADAALGHLHGLGKLVRDPELLVGPYLTREALASSRIEGTQASLSDVLQAEVSPRPGDNENIREVERYLSASRLGIRLVGTLPLSQRLVKQVHAELMQGVRGEDKQPGSFRTSPVWVGAVGDRPDTARYVPPLPSEISDLFADWERYVNGAGSTPVLIRCGLMHYQFETIHPFLDGNGRIGRLLIGLMLMDVGRLTTPLLYLSGYLEAHRREYYERLQAVREEGDLLGWLRFFLIAVREQAEDGVVRAARLIELREAYLAEASLVRSNLITLVDVLFKNPFVTVSRVEKEVGLTNQGARNLLKDAEARGWLEGLGRLGRGGRTWWIAHTIFEVIDAPARYGGSGPASDEPVLF